MRCRLASSSAGRFFASHEAPLKASLVSSPQVSAIFSVRLGGLPACLRRIMESTQTASRLFMSSAPRP